MEEEKSKSQKKRDAETLQKLGVKLIGLSKEKLEKLPLPPALYKAIAEAKALKSHGAIRRQAQLIGKQMRLADSDAITAAYEVFVAEDSSKTAFFHELEEWRDRLISGGKEALTAFICDYKTVDVQQLRQLIKKAVEEQQLEKTTGAAKALFRFLRSSL